jgi:hypothetical protein
MASFQNVMANIKILLEPEVEIKHIDFIADWSKKRKDLNFKMRKILVEWLCDVGLKYNCLNAIPFCVILTDYYLNRIDVIRKNLQSVGICSLIISNYILNNNTNINDVIAVYITAEAYSKDEIYTMLKNIISTCENKINPFNFYIEPSYINNQTLQMALTSINPRYTYKKLRKVLETYFYDEPEIEP